MPGGAGLETAETELHVWGSSSEEDLRDGNTRTILPGHIQASNCMEGGYWGKRPSSTRGRAGLREGQPDELHTLRGNSGGKEPRARTSPKRIWSTVSFLLIPSLLPCCPNLYLQV